MSEGRREQKSATEIKVETKLQKYEIDNSNTEELRAAIRACLYDKSADKSEIEKPIKV